APGGFAARQDSTHRTIWRVGPNGTLHHQALHQPQERNGRGRVAPRTDTPGTPEPRIRSVGRRSGRLRRGRRMVACDRLSGAKKPEEIGPLLIDWYARGHRDLPWRKTRDPYTILVSEIMLQQTRAQAVIPYYQRFLERFPTATALAAAAEDDVLALWSG